MERLSKKDKHILQQKLCDMKRRCNNPLDKNYKDYGGRGIKVCPEWSDPENGHKNFQNWAVENGWKKGLSIDRENNDGNYEPSNCRWATPKQQSNNTRFNRLITIGGKTKTVQEFADIVGISQRAMTGRIEAGWSEEDLLKPKYKPLKMTKAEMSKEIRMWRDLEEQRKLLKLPCNVGDIVYALWSIQTEQRYVVYPAEVKEIRFGIYGNRRTVKYRLEPISYRGRILDFYSDDFGNKLFLEESEAESALQKMNEMEGKE